MVRNDDDQSFVTLTIAELLHPESAASTITRRHDDESPWATVYYEAVSGPDDYDNMPIAMHVVAVEDNIEANPQQPQDVTSPSRRRTGMSHDDPSAPRPLPRPQPWQHSNLVDLILGFAISFCAFVTTIKIELTAIVIYTIAAGFYYLAEEVFSSTPAMLARSICLTLSGALMIVDPILLTVSVLVTELLGGIALLLCSIFGGQRSGAAWHQFIRKTCHLTRWGFRKCHKGWKPERIFPISMEDERSHLTAVPCDEPDAAVDIECAVSPRRQYRDSSAVHSQACCCCSPGAQPSTGACTCSTEESTMISEVTFLQNEEDMEYPPIAIAPENVSVIPEAVDDREDPLFKNTQHVVMA